MKTLNIYRRNLVGIKSELVDSFTGSHHDCLAKAASRYMRGSFIWEWTVQPSLLMETTQAIAGEGVTLIQFVGGKVIKTATYRHGHRQ